MTLPIRTALAASTTNRKWFVDVSTNGTSWTALMGITENNLVPDDATFQDDSDVDGGGAKAQVKTAFAWGGAVTVRRAPTAATPTSYDPGQEMCRAAAIGKTGPGNSIYVRWYEMEEDGPREEAYSGRAGVQWAAGGGGMDAPSRATITFQGQGALSQITHPDAWPVTFEDLAQFVTPGFELPFDGKTYTVPPPNARDGLWLQALMDGSASVALTRSLGAANRQVLLSDEQERTVYQLALGPAHDQMVADKVPWPVLKHAGVTAWMYWTRSEQAAEAFWASLKDGQGKAETAELDPTGGGTSPEDPSTPPPASPATTTP